MDPEIELIEEDDDADDSLIEPKRGPGRPRKPVVKKIVQREGIVNQPMNIEFETTQPGMVHIVELVYDNPMMFRKIFHLLQVMKVENVRVLFDRQVIKMYTQDHSKKNEIYIKIFCDKMNRYYCESPMEIGLGVKCINDVLRTLSNEHGKIIIAITRQYRRSKIKLIFCHDEMDDDSVYHVEINGIEPYDWQIEKRLKEEILYPIKFELPSKYFRKKITDYIKHSDIIRIEKTGYEHLRFSYNFKDKRGDHDTYWKNPGRINLESSIEEDDIFSTSVCLEHIKLFSGALISNNIEIAADKDRDLIFTCLLDYEEREKTKQKKYRVKGTEKCMVKIVTSIVRIN